MHTLHISALHLLTIFTVLNSDSEKKIKMSETIAMSEEPTFSSTTGDTPNTLCVPKGLNLSKDFPDQASADVYKNNNNNIIEDSTSSSSARDVGNYSAESHLVADKPFKRRESFSDECKMSVSPKENERTSVDEGDGKSTPSGRRSAEMSETGGSKFLSDSVDYPYQHHHTSLAANLQKRPIFKTENEGADHDDHPTTDYGQVHQDLSSSQRTMEQINMQHNFVGGAGSDHNEEMSDNEMMACDDDYESDSESNEPRITVREALMNRALAAAAAAAASSTSQYGSAGNRSGEPFSSEQVNYFKIIYGYSFSRVF